jgi:hypothetical protein
MNQSKEYRIARLYFLHDLITKIAEEEPTLIHFTDWNPNTDAINQMIELIDQEEDHA